MSQDARVFREHLSVIVLSALRGGPMYGYELAQAVKARSSGLLELREGVLYPALHRMVEGGLLTAQWGDSEKGPRRRYYRLTGKGKNVRHRQVNEWRQFASVIDRLVGAELCTA